MWDIYRMELHSAIKDETLSFATTWIDLEDIKLSELSQKDKYCLTPHMWNVKKYSNLVNITKEADSQIWRTEEWLPVG